MEAGSDDHEGEGEGHAGRERGARERGRGQRWAGTTMQAGGSGEGVRERGEAEEATTLSRPAPATRPRPLPPLMFPRPRHTAPYLAPQRRCGVTGGRTCAEPDCRTRLPCAGGARCQGGGAARVAQRQPNWADEPIRYIGAEQHSEKRGALLAMWLSRSIARDGRTSEQF
jgi:hypothetical protein